MNALSDNTIVSAAFSAGLEVYLVKQSSLTRFLFYISQRHCEGDSPKQSPIHAGRLLRTPVLMGGAGKTARSDDNKENHEIKQTCK